MKNTPKNLPSLPGIYFFKKRGKILYIGKAQNLKARISSYFGNNFEDVRKQQMVREATGIMWQETESDVEALIKEAELIKQYLPPYNVLMRDDKQYFYVGFTTGTYPKIFLTHQPTASQKSKVKNQKFGGENENWKLKIGNSAMYIGPFTDGTTLKYALRMLRRAFPYCTCKEQHKRPCQQSAVSNCLGVCCVENSIAKKIYPDYEERKRKYRRNIKAIRNVLSGKNAHLMKKLQKDMQKAAKRREYEKAALARNQLFALENIFQHRHFIRRDENAEIKKAFDYLSRLLYLPSTRCWTGGMDNLWIKSSTGCWGRIEGYDISNIQGKNAVGAMVVFINGVPAKNEYRHFNIRLPEKPNDIAMIREVMMRRLAHKEWQYPDVMVIDGGKGHLNAAIEVVKSLSHEAIKKIKIVALAKKEEELYLQNGRVVKLKEGPKALLHLLQRIRDEAHRFALAHHRKRQERLYA